jgi:hypothetical protein
MEDITTCGRSVRFRKCAVCPRSRMIHSLETMPCIPALLEQRGRNIIPARSAFVLTLRFGSLVWGQQGDEHEGHGPTDPYYMNMTGPSFAAGFETYFNMLLGTTVSWQAWAVGLLVLVLVCILLRSQLALFFLLWISHVPTRDFPHQSPVCILLVHWILWCFGILRDGCEKCLRHNREAKSSMVSEKRRLFGIRSCVFWRIHSAQRHYSIRESVG